jgi:hypothetical protein
VLPIILVLVRELVEAQSLVRAWILVLPIILVLVRKLVEA